MLLLWVCIKLRGCLELLCCGAVINVALAVGFVNGLLSLGILLTKLKIATDLVPPLETVCLVPFKGASDAGLDIHHGEKRFVGKGRNVSNSINNVLLDNNTLLW
ncbi:hypothetical protein Tco_1048932, partial [Tanacetum coccineum]